RRHLDRGAAATDHGNRPHLIVVIDWATLTGDRPEGRSEHLDGTFLGPEDARRLACDAQVCRLITGPHSEILDLGRTRRTVSATQWRALRHRDRHCRFPGCRRPTTWCDAHHLISWWEHQGPTDLDNLILLCRHHHTLIHRRGWKLTGTATHPTFTRPDGTTPPNAPPQQPLPLPARACVKRQPLSQRMQSHLPDPARVRTTAIHAGEQPDPTVVASVYNIVMSTTL